MKKVMLGFSVVALLATASCKKDNNNTQVTPTKENLVGTYKMTAATMNNINVFNNSIESLNMFEACDRDDLYKLNADLTYEVIDAGTVCDPDNSYTSEWDLTNSTTIVVDGEAGTINSFDGKTLVVSLNYGGTIAKSTYVKQ